MERFRDHENAIAGIAGLVVPIAIAGILVPFRNTFAPAASALVLVAIVVAVATSGSWFAGSLAAVSASLSFDFFLTQPYERFAITHRQDLETAISLLVVGIAVTEIAARNRINHKVADEEADHLGALSGMSELVASGAPVERIVERATDEFIDLLHLRRCRFETTFSDHTAASIRPDGHVVLGNLRWGAHQMGLPGREIELLVRGRGEPVGRFIFEATPGWPVSLQRRIVAVAIADQVGAVLSPHLRSA